MWLFFDGLPPLDGLPVSDPDGLPPKGLPDDGAGPALWVGGVRIADFDAGEADRPDQQFPPGQLPQGLLGPPRPGAPHAPPGADPPPEDDPPGDDPPELPPVPILPGLPSSDAKL